ncbi:SHOCT domain-containing protein [Agromyces atrinae]|uniref:SHOCT domain-containing protein n=1 Tax=Agromyces atrinae TaxID=592376 RepID=UPI001F5940E8|nr:SHOCT domain-containing protein [Agromyces atrinae]MCI2956618.1 SHOCT domain-containing protein [Agromyces atrinae]
MPLFRRVGRPGLIGLAARTAVVAGTATAVSGGMARRQQSRAAEQAEATAYEQQQVAPPAAPAPAAGGVDLVAELQKLGTLHQQGLLDDAEFAAAKARLLG